MPINPNLLTKLKPNSAGIVEVSLSCRQPKLQNKDIVELLRLLKTRDARFSLNLSDNDLTDASAELLAGFDRLVGLDLSENERITDTGVIALASNPSLRILALQQIQLTARGVQALARNTRLTELYIGYNNLEAEAAETFITNKTLRLLFINDNNIGNRGAKALAQNQGILRLNVSRNKIGGEGAKYLATNKVISYLELNSNAIGNEGARALLQSSTLRSCSILSNGIDEVLYDQLKAHIKANAARVESERNNVVLLALILALHKHHNNPALVSQLPVDTLIYLFDFISFPSNNLGWHRRTAGPCAQFIFNHIQEYQERLNDYDWVGHASIIEKKDKEDTYAPASFRFYHS